MAIIARSERSVLPNATPQRAVDVNAGALSSSLRRAGDSLTKLHDDINAQRDDLDTFETNIALTKFQASQDIRQREWDNAPIGDGRDHTANRLTEYDREREGVLASLPNNPRQRQRAELFLEQLRGNYGERSYQAQLGHIDTFKTQEITNLAFSQFIPNVTGDPSTVETAMAQVDMALGGTKLPENQKAAIRQSVAQVAFERWFDQSGPDAKTQADAMIAKYGAALPEKIAGRSEGVTDDEGMEFIRREEGFNAKAVWDYKQYSSGYGTKAAPGEVIDREEAERRLQAEVSIVDQWIGANIKVPLTQRQHNALTSFGYNLGTDDLDKLKEDINAGRFDRVATRMQSFNRADGVVLDGLTKRRGREAAAFAGAEPVGAVDETGAAATSPGPANASAYFVRALSGNLDKITLRVKTLREETDAQGKVDAWLSGAEAFNPFNDIDRKTVDKAFERSTVARALFAGDETAMRGAVNIATNLNYVPGTLAQALQGLTAQQDPARRAIGYRAIAAISAKQPYAFDVVSGGADLKKKAEEYTALVSYRGMAPDEAVARVDEMQTPEWKKLEAERRAVADPGAVALKDSDIRAAFDPSWLPFTTPAAPGGNQLPMLMADYRSAYRENFIRYGDDTLAKRMAAGELKRMWGISEATGRKVVTKYPPELFYPAVAGDRAYIQTQLEADVLSATGKTIDAKRIQLVADARTQREIANPILGQPPKPSYLVIYRDDNGLDQVLPGRWQPDANTARSAVKVEFDKAREDEKRRPLKPDDVEPYAMEPMLGAP